MSITKSQTEKIGSIFNGNRFVIPSYQRKYSWTENERKALWQDIEESLADDMNHFVGTLSFKENKVVGLSTDTLYEVIDGQQRITTIFVLLSVLIDKIEDSTTQKSQKVAFIGTADNLKLQPLGADGDFLKQVLFGFDDINISAVRKRSQRFMYAAKREYRAFVHPLSQQQVAERIIFIRERLEVLVFNVASQAQAVKMFSIINDRGLPLRILDKTKSILMLYSTLHLDDGLNDSINNSFEHIFDAYDDLLVTRDELGILGRLEENTIFTQHYFSARQHFLETWNNRNSAETIFDNLKYSCEQLRDKPEELRQFISDYISDFESFAVSYSSLIKEVETNTILQKPFRFLEFSATLYPLIVRLYMQNKLNDLLSILEAIEVRVYKLRGTNPIADIYWLSSDVAEYELSIEDIRDRLINFNEKFMNEYNFRNYLAADIYRNGSVKYILSEYCDQCIDIDSYKSYQVEHLFSQEPNFEPSSYGFAEDYDYEKNRIGNLTLIESGLNDGLGNQAPINKVSGYMKSGFEETRNLGGVIQQGGYGKEQVDKRRDEIIEFCVDRFGMNRE
ncbi:MAG: DUF262 domain-containing protein [Sphingobacteriales bacterium]|nr:MAG: DUF262 domain-containing protein [Sphingobacteriales bacterium]